MSFIAKKCPLSAVLLTVWTHLVHQSTTYGLCRYCTEMFPGPWLHLYLRRACPGHLQKSRLFPILPLLLSLFFFPIFKTCEFGSWLEQVELGFRIRSPVTQNVNCLPGHCTVSPKAGSSLKDRLTFKGTFVGEYVSFRSSWIHQVWLIYQYATSKAYLKHIFSTGVITLH